jgi:hypothetical protein
MKTIIEMAREAGFAINELHCSPPIITFVGQEGVIEAFAALVRADEREKSLKLWMLLDDIDTADDIAKTDHDTYRRLCHNIQQKRWAVLNESEVDAAIRARGQA